MAQNIATNPDFNEFDSEDYADLALAGVGEAGRTTAGSFDFFFAVILISVVLLLIISLIVWGFLRKNK